MLQNYLKTLYRSFLKNKSYSFINISGLAFGIAASVLLLMYVRDELKYDAHHEKADNIYLVSFKGNFGGEPINVSFTAAPIAQTMMDEFPEVLQATRFFADINSGNKLIEYEDKKFYESGFKWADSNVFEIFTYKLVKGNPKTALTQPNSVVISEDIADKYFGNENPIGKILKYNNESDYIITGVMKNVPFNSHFRFDFLASYTTLPGSRNPSWLRAETYCYLLLRENADAKALKSKFPLLTDKYIAPQVEQALGITVQELRKGGLVTEFYLQPLKSLYLEMEGIHEFAITSDIQYVYIFSAVALAILLIASINYVNLATARASNRAREVGMRKVLGSSKGQLIKQFMAESIAMSAISTFFAFVIIELSLPVFNNLADKRLTLSADLLGNYDIFLGMILISLFVGIFAGLYPALVISSYQPVTVLKGSVSKGGKQGWLRNSLVIAQFTVSIALLIGTIVIYKQLNFMQNMKLGFEKEQVLALQLESKDAINRFEGFKNDLESHPDIIKTATSEGIPGRFFLISNFQFEGAPTNRPYSLTFNPISYDFLDVLDIDIVTGRGFSREFPSDSTNAIIINEKAVRSFGWTNETALGKKLTINSRRMNKNRLREVVGVVKDFHFESPHEEIRGLAMILGAEAHKWVLIKVKPQNLNESLSFIDSKWSSFEPGYPFQYKFLDEDFNRLFKQEKVLNEFFIYFTSLAIFIACLGLFSLSSYITIQKTKEIGMRKVLGASSSSIMLLLLKKFTYLVIASLIIAFPLAYLSMETWLHDFAYRTDIEAYEFILAGTLSLIIAWLTVGYQSLKAAFANPIASLRFE